MIKPGKRTRWWAVIILCLVALGLVIAMPVRATILKYNPTHTILVMLHVESDLLEKTPAGRHYRALYWRNNMEFIQIYINKHIDRFAFVTWPFMDGFVPGLEALLNGKGDTVKVTREQIHGLQEELDWLLTQCSPALCADIKNEETRFPIQTVIGITYAQAWDAINAAWDLHPVEDEPAPSKAPSASGCPPQNTSLPAPLDLVNNIGWEYLERADLVDYPPAASQQILFRAGQVYQLVIYPVEDGSTVVVLKRVLCFDNAGNRAWGITDALQTGVLMHGQIALCTSEATPAGELEYMFVDIGNGGSIASVWRADLQTRKLAAVPPGQVSCSFDKSIP
jgi:hypothetical protein